MKNVADMMLTPDEASRLTGRMKERREELTKMIREFPTVEPIVDGGESMNQLSTLIAIVARNDVLCRQMGWIKGAPKRKRKRRKRRPRR